ncbi:MAG: translation initiation factor IF-2, partial [Bacteroidetes bacterium]|nr:translation initiation factor IF-2 [Bacteroidota bacterium]MBU1761603.1 translation initiation factor IF-2 [Bacteroidota bacterium]
MSEDKNLGILKVAKELNIGIGTIAEFLNGKGFKVEARPNTKLTSDMYNDLLKEYQGDKILKEEAKSIVIGKIRRDDVNIVIDSNDTHHTSALKQEEEPEEILIKNTGSTAPAFVPAEKEPEVKPASISSETSPGVKIIGKIDLASLNSKTRPDKKTKVEEVVKETPKPVEPKVEEAKEAPKTVEPEVVKEVPKAVEPKVEEIKETPKF